jgi:hypothetical protein
MTIEGALFSSMHFDRQPQKTIMSKHILSGVSCLNGDAPNDLGQEVTQESSMARTWFGSSRPLQSALLPVLLLAACGVGCSSNDSEQCNISTPPQTASADGTVTYSASITGDATLDSVVYRTQDGPKTVGAPTSPFQIDVTVQSGLGIGITATGITKPGGNLTVTSSFLPTGGTSPTVAYAHCH